MNKPTWNSPPNWPTPPEGWSPPAGWQPNPEWGPAPDGWKFDGPPSVPTMASPSAPTAQFERPKPLPSDGPPGGFLRRRWVLPAAAGLLGLIVGGAVGGGGSDDTVTTDAASETSLDQGGIDRLMRENKSLSDKNTDLGDQVTKLKGELGEAKQQAPAAPPSPKAAPPPADPPPAAESDLSDGDFTSAQPKLTKDFGGSFSGTGRVTNTSDGELTATFTYTLFKGDKEVGTLAGVANEVGAGDTATVQLISQDDFVTGVDRIEFQVDAAF